MGLVLASREVAVPGPAISNCRPSRRSFETAATK